MTVWSTLATLFARLLAMVGPLGVSVITARTLGPEDRGVYFLVIAYAQIASQFGNLGLHSSNTYLVAANRERLAAILTNSLVVAPIGGFLAAVPIVLWLGLGGDNTAQVTSLALALAPLLVMFLLITNVVVAVGQVMLFNLLTILSGFLALTTAVLAALMGGGTAQFLWAAIVALAVSCLVGVLSLLPQCRWRLRLDWHLLRVGVTYSARAYFATLAGFLMSRTGVLILQAQGNIAVVGQFSIAQQITDALILFPSTVGLLLFPHLLRIQDQADRISAMWKAALSLGGVMALMLVVIGILTPYMVPLVFGAQYQPAVSLVLAFLPSTLLMTLIIVVSQFLSAEGFPLQQVLIWVSAAVMHVAISVVLVPKLGALTIPLSLGISLAFALGSLTLLAMSLIRQRTTPA